MTIGPSMLSLSASAIYMVVLLACLAAAVTAARFRQRPAHVRLWFLLAAIFAILCVMRVLAVEEWLRDYLRDTLRASGSYRDRRSLQGPIIASILVIFAFAGSIMIYRWARNLRGRRNFMVLAGTAAALAIGLLIVLRLTSLHAVDALLYGPLKLNWVIDLGASLVVMLTAFNYVRLVRARP